jgi:phosphoglycolate phosphatase
MVFTNPMKIRDIEAIIFDLDGTLIDSLTDIANAANQTIGKLNAPSHSIDAYRYFVGDGLFMLMKRALPADTGDEVISESCRVFKAIYEKNWYNTTRPYNGIEELLSLLVESGIKLAVLSNKPHLFTQQCVARFFPDAIFYPVYGYREGIPAKPDPTGAQSIADTLKVSPGKCVFVGDSSVDMHTAVAAHMIPVGVAWGFRSVKELKEAGARKLLYQPKELLDYVTNGY